LGRLGGERKHVSAPSAVGSDEPLGFRQDALRVDESLKPSAEAAMGRADHRFRLVSSPRGQATNPSS
jgi:hypothetical protein